MNETSPRPLHIGTGIKLPSAWRSFTRLTSDHRSFPVCPPPTSSGTTFPLSTKDGFCGDAQEHDVKAGILQP